MKAPRWIPLAVAAASLAVVGLGPLRTALASHVSARAAGAGLDSTDVLAQWGFGDRQNSMAWGMTWFKGKLYVGTGRDEICVERVTTDFYYPFAHTYKSRPEPGVSCPNNPYNLDLRAEIWQYTPSTQTWRMVYRAPADIRNPRAPGKHVSSALAFRGMTVVRDPQGRQALFVSGVSTDEYLPELAVTHPPQLLRTYDGVHFQNIVKSPFVVHRTGRYSDVRPMGFRGLVQWRHDLYVVASSSLTGAGAVYRIDQPWGENAHFSQVSPRSTQVFELQPFRGHLYLGTGNASGYGVLKVSESSNRCGALLRRSRRGQTSRKGGRARFTRSELARFARCVRRHPRYHLQPVVINGAGRGHYMTSVVAMQAYRGWLYVSAAGWYCLSCNALPASELIRIAPDGHWQVVAGTPRFVPLQSRTKYPISGLGDGFDNIFNAHLWRMTVAGNALYVGTNDWSWLLQNDKAFLGGYPGLLGSLLSGEMGFDVWATCDGTNFFPVTRNAFGVDLYDFGVRTIVGVHGGVYIGSADQAHGTRIYHQPSNVCQGFAKPAAATAQSAQVTPSGPPAAPQALLTDVQRGGTVLSWQPSAHVSRYEVLRAAYQQVPYTYDPPVPLPGGNLFDDAAPLPAAPGSPGSETAMLPLAGAYTPVGTTANSYFVDRSARRHTKYAYRIVAVGRSGVDSLGSNVQVVPDPRPPATFGQLERLLPVSQAVATAAMARTGTCTRTMSAIARVARTAGSVDARELASRLERRLKYRNVAGGPVNGSLPCG